MPTKFRGVMQSPVTPFKDDFSLDLPTFERLLDFHVRTGATAISWPHHKGEFRSTSRSRSESSSRKPPFAWSMGAYRSPFM